MINSTYYKDSRCEQQMIKRAIVTGADGFIGRNLTSFLSQCGYEVYAFVFTDNNTLKEISNLSNVHFVPCDLNNVLDCAEMIPDGVDIMYHFAWAGVKPELRADMGVQLSNIPLTIKCMEFASQKKVKRILVPGSTSEYLYCGQSVNSKAIPTPRDAYGSVKVALRYLCAEYAKQHNIEFLYAVITGIYAADRRDNNVIYYTIDSLLREEKPSLTKLEQLWDYVYIDDAVQALFAVGEKGRPNLVYAIGHGDNWPLRNYIEIIRDKINPTLPLGIGEVSYKESELPCSCVDLTDLERDTGFVPKVDFETGIEKVISRVRKDRIVHEQEEYSRIL